MKANYETIYCDDCKTKAVVHADGSVACSCSFVDDPDSDTIPPAWNTTAENVYAIQLAESDLEDDSMATTQGIKKGDRVVFKPEWQDAGDENIVFLAIEDEEDGRVLVEAQVDLPIKPTQLIETRMVAR